MTMDGKVWLSLALIVALGVPLTAFGDSAPMVSITALLANPAKYSGKTVLVTGYYLARSDLSALCSQRRVASTLECIFVLKGKVKDINAFHSKPVFIEGKFEWNNGGDDMYSGRLTPDRMRKLPEVRDESDTEVNLKGAAQEF